MAYLLAIATTEAMDPTRVSDPFRTTSAGQDIDRVSPREADHQTLEPRVRITKKEVHNMAAKKKAAKKPAAKKKASKKK